MGRSFAVAASIGLLGTAGVLVLASADWGMIAGGSMPDILHPTGGLPILRTAVCLTALSILAPFAFAHLDPTDVHKHIVVASAVAVPAAALLLIGAPAARQLGAVVLPTLAGLQLVHYLTMRRVGASIRAESLNAS